MVVVEVWVRVWFMVVVEVWVRVWFIVVVRYGSQW